MGTQLKENILRPGVITSSPQSTQLKVTSPSSFEGQSRTKWASKLVNSCGTAPFLSWATLGLLTDRDEKMKLDLARGEKEDSYSIPAMWQQKAQLHSRVSKSRGINYLLRTAKTQKHPELAWGRGSKLGAISCKLYIIKQALVTCDIPWLNFTHFPYKNRVGRWGWEICYELEREKLLSSGGTQDFGGTQPWW